MPSRSLSTYTAGPPSDAQAPDDKAINDVYRSVEETGSLELAAKKLQKFATQQRGWEDDPEEMAYLATKRDVDDEALDMDDEDREEEEMEVVHLQEALPGLWIGDLVAAMDVRGLEQRGIVSVHPIQEVHADLRPMSCLCFDLDWNSLRNSQSTLSKLTTRQIRIS